MMNEPLLGIVGLTSGFLLLGLLLLNLNLYSRWAWQFKAVAILLTSGFFVITYLSWNPPSGLADQGTAAATIQVGRGACAATE